MFDIQDPFLVFETHCVDIFDIFTGYIFRWYEPNETEPRELFFSHIIEAQLYAKARCAVFSMHPGSHPRRVTVEDFLRNHESESFGHSNWSESVNSHTTLSDLVPEPAAVEAPHE